MLDKIPLFFTGSLVDSVAGDEFPLVKKIAIAISAKPKTIATGIAIDERGLEVGSIRTIVKNKYKNYSIEDMLYSSNMNIGDAIVLGLVQGVTEFLPISSTGHLVLVRELLTINEANMLAVDAVLHLATTLAVVLYFWSDLWTLLQALLRKLGRLPVNEKDLMMVYALVIGTIPAVVLGVLLEPVMTKFQTPEVIAVFLALAAIFFLFVEWKYFLRPEHGSVTIKRAWKVGLFQALALVPGLSRSGTTIAGGMLLGMSRYEASRFSFLLAIPITLGVGIKKS